MSDNNIRRRMLEFIYEYKKEHDYMPTYREIQDGLQLKSIATVNYHFSRLLALGIFETDAPLGSPRAYRFRKEYTDVE